VYFFDDNFLHPTTVVTTNRLDIYYHVLLAHLKYEHHENRLLEAGLFLSADRQ